MPPFPSPCRAAGLVVLLAFSIATPAVAGPSAIPATQAVGFDLYLPIRDGAGLAALIESQNQPGSADYHRWLTPRQFAERFGPSQTAIAGVTASLEAHGMTVTSRRGQKLHVEGAASAIEAAFKVRLIQASGVDKAPTLAADRPLSLPAALAESGAVLPQFSMAPPFQHNVIAFNGNSPTGRYTTADLRQAYDYPSAEALTARGVHIGILMDGAVNESDLADYWAAVGLPDNLKPSVETIPVNGGHTAATKEATLDIQQSGGMSLAASIHLYSIPDLTHTNILAGLTQIIEDNVADVVNMSFSGAEVLYLPANNNRHPRSDVLDMEHLLFQQGTAQGMTFVGSSGDHGAIPMVNGQPTLSVEYPASDPYVVGVGGTNLVTTYVPGSRDSAYVGENANHDWLPNGEVWGSGGGISIFWPKPRYQYLVPTLSARFRTVPDIAGHMGGCPAGAVQCNHPDSADLMIFDGQTYGELGTSASAPDIAGLFALKVALTGGRLGWENVDIYRRAQKDWGFSSPFHHRGIPGNNGHYTTKMPYDFVVGNGTPMGRRLLGATKLPAAGIPLTPSNP